jgi:hypothetical protein
MERLRTGERMTAKLKQIAKKRDELEGRVLDPEYTATERDVAESAELVNLYIDELIRLEETATVAPFLSADAVADKVLSYWSYDG